jgi:hypothetical protein
LIRILNSCSMIVKTSPCNTGDDDCDYEYIDAYIAIRALTVPCWKQRNRQHVLSLGDPVKMAARWMEVCQQTIGSKSIFATPTLSWAAMTVATNVWGRGGRREGGVVERQEGVGHGTSISSSLSYKVRARQRVNRGMETSSLLCKGIGRGRD